LTAPAGQVKPNPVRQPYQPIPVMFPSSPNVACAAPNPAIAVVPLAPAPVPASTESIQPEAPPKVLSETPISRPTENYTVTNQNLIMKQSNSNTHYPIFKDGTGAEYISLDGRTFVSVKTFEGKIKTQRETVNRG